MKQPEGKISVLVVLLLALTASLYPSRALAQGLDTAADRSRSGTVPEGMAKAAAGG